MAAGMLPAPGSDLGPCVEPCRHPDCASTRLMATAICRFCQKTIGYDTRFYADPEAKTFDPRPLVHALCLELEVEQRR